MVDQLNAFASEVTRVAREVGSEGSSAVRPRAGRRRYVERSHRLGQLMASNLTSQVRNIAKVTTAVANGDLSKKITVDVRGEILELKDTINTMVDQLNAFAGEVTRVAREVGSEGEARRSSPRAGRRAARGKTSPTPSTRWPPTSPNKCAVSRESSPALPTATSSAS